MSIRDKIKSEHFNHPDSLNACVDAMMDHVKQWALEIVEDVADEDIPDALHRVFTDVTMSWIDGKHEALDKIRQSIEESTK